MSLTGVFQRKRLVYSMEVFPPKKTSSVETIYTTLAGLRGLPVDYISVTYGAGGTEGQKNKTLEIASLIKSEYGIEPLAHLLCLQSDREELTSRVGALASAGVENIMALRGDLNPERQPGKDFQHASDLMRFITALDPSLYIVGACYPEVHAESVGVKDDIAALRLKQEAGARHLVSQLFFDNDKFYRFLERADLAGVALPIQAGIMPIVRRSQIERTVTMCGASIPSSLAAILNRYADIPEALEAAGIAYATQQIVDLIAHGVQGIHLYTMNNTDIATRISENIRGLLDPQPEAAQ